MMEFQEIFAETEYTDRYYEHGGLRLMKVPQTDNSKEVKNDTSD